jgi:prevent-host-death family protein
MHLDFAILPMTDLRNTPGEILDRVADGGEAFIIERNGKQKACLVPMSVFLPDIAPARIAQEMDELLEHGKQPKTAFTEQRELSLTFSVVADDGEKIAVTILLPHGYPNNCPRVFAEGVDSGAPHRWTDGALCLYGVMTGWNPGKHTVLSTLQLARQWISNYQTWKTSGRWPEIGETGQ